ncbi:MAG: hypothetical protein ACOYI4_04890 [Christensenellales bacterium]|jgi:hypothetical protein
MQIFIYDIPVQSQKIFKKTFQVIRPAGAYFSLPIAGRDASSGTITLSNGLLLKSRNLMDMLSDCEEVVFIAATVADSTALMEKVAQTSLADTAMVDEELSEMVNNSVAYIIKMLNANAIKKGKRILKKRICPGFGDFDLSYQKMIFDLLKLDRLDMSITPDYMLLPQKSVLTVTGVTYESEE